MTPHEWAEKIAKEYCEGEFTSEKYETFKVYLAAQMEEALEEQRTQITGRCEKHQLTRFGACPACLKAEIEEAQRIYSCDECFQAGFNVARQKAAEIVGFHEDCEESICIDRKMLAERIRRMEISE